MQYMYMFTVVCGVIAKMYKDVHVNEKVFKFSVFQEPLFDMDSARRKSGLLCELLHALESQVSQSNQ